MDTYRTDPSQNFIKWQPQALDALFHPKTIALIGAKDTPGSVGFTLMTNLLNPLYQGKIYPVNPKRTQVLGIQAYPSINDVPEAIDLAIIVTPAETVPKIIEECVEAKVKTAIIISAGFKELGEKGLKLEEEFLRHAHRGAMPIIGPNCLGVMNPLIQLNATFARGIALPGHLAFISQSGAMCTGVLEWSYKQKVGFSAIASVGSMADVSWGSLIDYFGNDPHTHSLFLYMETIGDARAFMTAAREVALEKPIIVIKAGKSKTAAKVAASHSGSLAASDEVFNAALDRIGVLRVDSIGEFFSMALVLSKQPLPKGPHLTILTNTGGIGVLTTDAAVTSHAELTTLSDATLAGLDKELPPAWSHGNPVDILGDALADRYRKSLEILVNDPNTDGILTIVSPQDMTDLTATAAEIIQVKHSPSKLILASWMGGENAQKGIELLAGAEIPNFDFPDDAAKTFATMWQYCKNLKMLYETPMINQLEGKNADRFLAKQNVEKIIDEARAKNRENLTEDESKQVLDDYHIPVARTLAAKDRNEYELILGSFTDPQFGPVIIFGMGGQLVDIYNDRAFAIPPLNRNLARQLMEKTKIYQALVGIHGRKPVNLSKLEDILINFSLMIVENTRIMKCDINPLIVSDEEIIALDARILLHDSGLPDEQLPQLAIRPYPLEYIAQIRLKNGQEITLRPIRPEDEPRIIDFHKELSERTVRQRYFGFMSLNDRVSHDRLLRVCFNDYDREWVIVAEIGEKVVGIGGLYRIPNTKQAEFKMTIIDEYHNLGLGTQLMHHLIKIAKKEKIGEMQTSILVEDERMIKVCKKNNFDIVTTHDPLIVNAVWKNDEVFVA